jgi:shikimate kinase
MKKIILLGWLRKSTIAKALSKTIKVPFVDLDTYIEKSGIIDKCYF